jgi:hypothetical protein
MELRTLSEAGKKCPADMKIFYGSAATDWNTGVLWAILKGK